MTFRKISISVSLLFLLSVSVFGQQENVAQKKNALKLNSAALAFSNASMLYERSLNKHWSVLAAAGYKWGNNVPKVLGLGNLIVESPTGGLRAYSFTPEARYYFNVCECKGSPSGFYAGLYYRMSNYYGELSFQYWNGAEYLEALVATNFREMGVGIQLGYQLVIKQRFLVDFMFAGPRMSGNKLKFSMSSDHAEDLVPILEEEINKRLEWLGKDPISLDPSPEVETKFGYSYFRYALGIGILF